MKIQKPRLMFVLFLAVISLISLTILMSPLHADLLIKLYFCIAALFFFVSLYYRWAILKHSISLTLYIPLAGIAFFLALTMNALINYWEGYLFLFFALLSFLDLLRRILYRFKNPTYPTLNNHKEHLLYFQILAILFIYLIGSSITILLYPWSTASAGALCAFLLTALLQLSKMDHSHRILRYLIVLLFLLSIAASGCLMFL